MPPCLSNKLGTQQTLARKTHLHYHCYCDRLPSIVTSSAAAELGDAAKEERCVSQLGKPKQAGRLVLKGY